MSLAATLAAIAVLALLLVASAILQSRRGLGGWSLLPWDYVMILSAILLLISLAHGATLWRDQP